MRILALTACVASVASAAESYLIIDNQTGRILASRNRDEKRQIASVTKIATAVVTFDWAQIHKADLSQRAVISAGDLRAGAGGVNPAGLQEGDALSLRDLLYCALMASDNVAATALARHVGAQLPNPQSLDPVGNFVTHMNALARTLEMKKTLFLNPSGFDSNREGGLPHSTASDVARLTRYAYSEADFPFYVAQKSRVVHVFRGGDDIPVRLQNTNTLLDQAGIDGVKTGRTSRAGDCIVLSAEQKPEVQRQGETVYVTPRRIIVVILGSRDRVTEGAALVREGWSLYEQWAAGGRQTKGSQTL